MIDNRVIGDIWSAKGEEKEKVVNRSSGEKKPWTAIVCHFLDRREVADVFSSRRVPNRDSVFVCVFGSGRIVRTLIGLYWK
jgi:hypothetical protein